MSAPIHLPSCATLDEIVRSTRMFVQVSPWARCNQRAQQSLEKVISKWFENAKILSGAVASCDLEGFAPYWNVATNLQLLFKAAAQYFANLSYIRADMRCELN